LFAAYRTGITLTPIQQAFFPKNRGHWKQFSSWEPEEKLKRGKHEEDDSVKELQVKKGFSETEQIGVVIAALIENNKGHLVDWVTDVRVFPLCRFGKVE
jgi:replication fork protection complex subunit Tof1/Swi1